MLHTAHLTVVVSREQALEVYLLYRLLKRRSIRPCSLFDPFGIKPVSELDGFKVLHLCFLFRADHDT